MIMIKGALVESERKSPDWSHLKEEWETGNLKRNVSNSLVPVFSPQVNIRTSLVQC